jgi:hypothetical protein
VLDQLAAVACLTLTQQLPEMRAPKDTRASVALSQYDCHFPAFLPTWSYLLSDCNTIALTNYTTALDHLDIELTSTPALRPVPLFKLRSIGDRVNASALDCDTTTIDDVVTQIGYVDTGCNTTAPIGWVATSGATTAMLWPLSRPALSSVCEYTTDICSRTREVATTLDLWPMFHATTDDDDIIISITAEQPTAAVSAATADDDDIIISITAEEPTAAVSAATTSCGLSCTAGISPVEGSTC